MTTCAGLTAAAALLIVAATMTPFVTRAMRGDPRL
jgi:hypothetical protein